MTENIKDKLQRLETRTCTEVHRILDAKVELLWKLGLGRDRPKIPTYGQIEAVSDAEFEIAQEAQQAIGEKYGIKKHDFAMFQRANDLWVFYGLTRTLTTRVDASQEFWKLIKWH